MKEKRQRWRRGRWVGISVTYERGRRKKEEGEGGGHLPDLWETMISEKPEFFCVQLSE